MFQITKDNLFTIYRLSQDGQLGHIATPAREDELQNLHISFYRDHGLWLQGLPFLNDMSAVSPPFIPDHSQAVPEAGYIAPRGFPEGTQVFALPEWATSYDAQTDVEMMDDDK